MRMRCSTALCACVLSGCYLGPPNLSSVVSERSGSKSAGFGGGGYEAAQGIHRADGEAIQHHSWNGLGGYRFSGEYLFAVP
jgi:hypothetical protein